MKTELNAFIFDLDGTLIDSRRGVQESIEDAVRRVIPNLPLVDFSPFIGPPIKKILTNALGTLPEEDLQRISMEFRAIFDSGYCLKCDVYPGVREALDQLAARSIPIYLATNKPRIATDQVLHHHGLARYFKCIQAPDLGSGKGVTKDVMLRELVTSETLDRAKTVMVGDTMEDWDAARASAIHFAACLYGYGLKEEQMNDDCLVLSKIEDLNNLMPKQ
jgi:phosphoglycolate phosphatase